MVVCMLAYFLAMCQDLESSQHCDFPDNQRQHKQVKSPSKNKGIHKKLNNFLKNVLIYHKTTKTAHPLRRS